ncbi:MAG TPA: hypothetical protein H9756_12350 [Candidatus Mediterraneibacter gallistercoris]|uniref:Uncharacterized protein n=1 Tax=Candidatus Mediterraneibacter gallistercoris TaxID=2838671 RepID=A0A9D2T2U6_9FIRM|nr:hypothetical protein [Candidatus Mediterraneibacter gallistercoris]
MVDKRKVRLMTKAAIYEKRHGEEDIKITGYYQKDYASLNTWITLIWVTVGFVLLAALLFLAGGEDLLEGITFLKLLILAVIILGLYLALLIIYGIGAGSFYRKKHTRAKHRMKRYMRNLSRLEKMNLKKEKHRS